MFICRLAAQVNVGTGDTGSAVEDALRVMAAHGIG